MSFRLGDIIVKNVLWGVSLDITTKVPQYVLPQLSGVDVNVTSESNDVADKDGNIIFTNYLAKQAEVTSTSALLNSNIATAGSEVKYADGTTKVVVPMLDNFKKGETFDLKTKDTNDVTSVIVMEYYGNGTIGKQLILTTDYVITEGIVKVNDNFSTDAPMFFISYNRTFGDNAVKISNIADKFPEVTRMLFKITYYDPCDTTEIKAGYLEFPRFQRSPEISIPFNAESAEIEFSGRALLPYCDGDKTLYNLYFYDETEESDETP